MAKHNPISLGTDGPFKEYKIPEENVNDNIKMSIIIELLEDGWSFDSDHIVTIQGNDDDLYNNDDSPDKLLIGKGEEIIGKKFQ